MDDDARYADVRRILARAATRDPVEALTTWLLDNQVFGLSFTGETKMDGDQLVAVLEMFPALRVLRFDNCEAAAICARLAEAGFAGKLALSLRDSSEFFQVDPHTRKAAVVEHVLAMRPTALQIVFPSRKSTAPAFDRRTVNTLLREIEAETLQLSHVNLSHIDPQVVVAARRVAIFGASCGCARLDMCVSCTDRWMPA